MQRYFASMDLQTSCTAEWQELKARDRVQELGDGRAMIARGAGLSFVGATFGIDVCSIGTDRLDTVLHFDRAGRRVTVEAGMRLGALYDFLLPHGLYLPSQPGHPQISIGGCIASNVHGKNPQKDGLFADTVESLELYHPDHGVLTLSRQQEPELFDLTCGGFGLTGVILSATLRLAEIPSAVIEVKRVPVRSLADAWERIEVLKSEHDFLYTWHDLSTFGADMGRGYVCCGKFVAIEATRPEPLPTYRRLPSRTRPPRLPRLMRPSLIPLVTGAHYYWRRWRPIERISLSNMLYPGMGTGDFYFDLYGRKGFFAHMVLVPFDRWREYVQRLDQILRRHREPIIALAMKAFAGRQRLLHFNGTGLSMHSHIPNTPGGQALLTAMEDLGMDLGLIRTLYFDSRLSAATARALYPEYDEFRRRLHRFDPKRIFVSALSRRLDL